MTNVYAHHNISHSSIPNPLFYKQKKVPLGVDKNIVKRLT